jgi:hypothetical protein
MKYYEDLFFELKYLSKHFTTINIFGEVNGKKITRVKTYYDHNEHVIRNDYLFEDIVIQTIWYESPGFPFMIIEYEI